MSISIPLTTPGSTRTLPACLSDRKLRVRWYGLDLAQAHAPQLELKRKRGLTGWKEIVPVTRDLDLVRSLWSELQQEVWSALGSRVPNWLARFPQPVLINSYWREYFATPDGAIRLTVDTDLRAFDQRSSSRPNLRRPPEWATSS